MSEWMLRTEHIPFLPKILACRTTYKQLKKFLVKFKLKLQIKITRAQATITDHKFQIESNISVPDHHWDLSVGPP